MHIPGRCECDFRYVFEYDISKNIEYIDPWQIDTGKLWYYCFQIWSYIRLGGNVNLKFGWSILWVVQLTLKTLK